MKYSKESFIENSYNCLIPTEEELINIEATIIKFLKGYFSFYGFRKAVIGLSGGIDSTVTAYLLKSALGEGNVYGVIIPSKHTSFQHINYALHICKVLNIEYNDYDIVKEYFDDTLELLQNMGERESAENKQRIKAGNIQARIRMIILRDIAKKYQGLVVGTTNKTEAKLGYATIAGDGLGGVDLEPILGLYKTPEKVLASYLEIPEEIIVQPPSAELWDGQTDEQELGMDYASIDQILLGLELNITADEIVKAMNGAIKKDDIYFIENLIKQNIFKNKLPPTISL